MTYKKILVALDRKEKLSQEVFKHAVRLAAQEKAELKVLTCLDKWTAAEVEDRIGTYAQSRVDDVIQKQENWRKTESAHVQAWLDEICAETAEHGIQAGSMVEFGRAGNAIIDFAEQWDADLIILGRTQRSVIGHFILGTVSNYVMYHAKCSILFVHESRCAAIP